MAYLEEVMEVLAHSRFVWATEDDLQAGLEQAFREAGLPVEREVRVDARNRIDLVVGRTGIEAKVKGTPGAALRQLSRYAALDEIDAVVLVTNVPGHAQYMPVTLYGKPVGVHLVGSTL